MRRRSASALAYGLREAAGPVPRGLCAAGLVGSLRVPPPPGMPGPGDQRTAGSNLFRPATIAAIAGRTANSQPESGWGHGRSVASQSHRRRRRQRARARRGRSDCRREVNDLPCFFAATALLSGESRKRNPALAPCKDFRLGQKMSLSRKSLASRNLTKRKASSLPWRVQQSQTWRTVYRRGRRSARLALRFGPLPVLRKTFRYADITGVEIGRTSVIDGWGIHYMPGRGWTYNLWGFNCVKLCWAERSSAWGPTTRRGWRRSFARRSAFPAPLISGNVPSP